MITRYWTPYPQIQPATVFGELSADGRDICIVVTGDPYKKQHAIALLSYITPLGTKVANGHALTVPCTWPAVTQLAMTFGVGWQPGGRLQEWIMREVARRTQWRDLPLRYQIPPGLALKPWQPTAVRQVAHIGCLLEDEPRLGKTISTIVGLAERECWGHTVRPIIVICPASVITSWVREFKKWAPHWRTVAWRGATKDARRLLVGRHDVYVSSYDIARNDARAGVRIAEAPLLRVRPQSVVIDEYHWINNPEAKRTLAAQRIARQAQIVIALSGTPFLHDFSGTQPTLEVFEPGAFPSKERLQERYCLEIPQDYGSKIVGIKPDREAELRTCLLGRHIRRAREDVAEYLSKKTYSTRYIEIPPKYRKTYDDMEERMIAELDSGAEVTAMDTRLKTMRLQQLSAAACEMHCTYTENPIAGEPDIEHQHLTPILPSWKIDAMLDVLAELEWPAIAFAVSRPLIELAGQAATAAGARVGYVIGGQRTRTKDADIDAFQDGKLDLLCITSAGGTGLTLSAAGSMIFLQRPFSYVESVQAEDRGVGDRYPTLDIVDIFAGETVDQRIRDILHTKAGQLAQYHADPRIVRQLFGGVRTPKPHKEKKSA